MTSEENKKAAAQSTHHGSQKRQRVKGISVACTPAEHAELIQKAQAAGLSLGGYLRAVGLGRKTARTKRRASINVEALAHAVSELRRVGNNLNQIARGINRGEGMVDAELSAALRLYVAAMRQLMDAATGEGRPP